MRKLVVRLPGKEDRLKRQWKWNPKKRAVENRDLGVIFQVVDVIHQDTEEIHHEGFVILSRRIELHIVARDDGYIGLVFHRREKTIPPIVAEKFFLKNPNKTPNISHIKGIEQFECPHGIAVQALAEAEEETGYKVNGAISIGFVKESPSWGGVAHVLYATRLSKNVASVKNKENGEQIMDIKFFSPEKIGDIQTICGLTQAALWRFRLWGLKQPKKSFWYSIAAKL